MSVLRLAYEAEGWGAGELHLAGDVLLFHELPRGRPASGPPRASSRYERNGERRADGERRSAESATPHPLVERLRRYFAGQPGEFGDVALDLSGFTPFQRAVAAALRAVPAGEVVTYGELAALAGYPNAHRAVGSFCARNRFAVVVPCHRVVASTGLGPFGSLGGAYKRRLLALEGVAL